MKTKHGMNSLRLYFFQAGLMAVILLACSSCALERTSPEPALNKEIVEDFALLDHRGEFHELYYYSDRKAVVFISHGVGCPIVRKSATYLEGLRARYGPKGVAFFMINGNTKDERANIVQDAEEYGIRMPILEDPSQVITKMLGIKRTAEAVVVDTKDWSVVYRGPIHDQFGYETERKNIGHPYLENAIKSIIENKPAPKDRPQTLGCLISFEQERAPDFINDIAPILSAKCLSCHSPGQIGPWSMDNYENVRGWASMIREVVLTRRMPPWGADPHYRKLLGDLSLKPEEIRAINDWVLSGSPRGEGEDPLLSVKRPPVGDWPLGKPDMILSDAKPREIPANGRGYYLTWTPAQTLDQDRWIKTIDWRIGNRKATHHTLLKVHQNGSSKLIEGYTPGRKPLFFPDGVGIFFPKGSHFTVDMHYTPTGKPETDDTQVGLYFLDKPAQISVKIKGLDLRDIFIPPHAKKTVIKRNIPFPGSAKIFAIKPHMHLRARSDKYIAHYPDGKTETILSVPQYRFNSQSVYVFQEPLRVPAGTQIETVAVYDNSAQNPHNPDPNQAVRWGEKTEDEMRATVFWYQDE